MGRFQVVWPQPECSTVLGSGSTCPRALSRGGMQVALPEWTPKPEPGSGNQNGGTADRTTSLGELRTVTVHPGPGTLTA